MTAQIILNQAIAAIATNMNALTTAGARRFLVVGAPDIALAPAVVNQGPAAVAAARTLTQGFNAGLDAVLDQFALNPVLDIRHFDFFALTERIAAQPEEFGLSNITDSCITPGVIAGALCANANDYLFWDGIHPTRAAHRLVGEAVTIQLRE